MKATLESLLRRRRHGPIQVEEPLLSIVIEDSAVPFRDLDDQDRSQDDVDIVSESKSIEFTGIKRSHVSTGVCVSNLGKESHFGRNNPRQHTCKAAGSDIGLGFVIINVKDDSSFKTNTSSPDKCLDPIRYFDSMSKELDLESKQIFKKRRTTAAPYAAPYKPSARYAPLSAESESSKDSDKSTRRAGRREEGASFCEQSRTKSRCKECGGGSICLHGRRKSRCKECGGGSICGHGRERSRCKE